MIRKTRSLYSCCRNFLISPSVSAPMKWLTGFPSLKAITVGSDRIYKTWSIVKHEQQSGRLTRYLWASSNSLSVSTVTKSRKRPLPVLILESSVSFSSMGEISLHGPHQLKRRTVRSGNARACSYKLCIEINQDYFIVCMLVQCNFVKGLGQMMGRLLSSPEHVTHTF